MLWKITLSEGLLYIVYMHFMNLNMTFNEEVLDWIMPINTKKMCVIDSHAMLILSDNVEAF